MAQFRLPVNSRVKSGKTYKVDTGAKNVRTFSVYRYDPVDGSVQLAIGAKQIEKPNGLALSPDGNTLYVAENNNAPGGRMTLNAFRLRSDGSLGPKKVIVDFGDEAGIDGMTVDVQGNIYAAVRSARRFGLSLIHI
mgnify:CR=1 FL=1